MLLQAILTGSFRSKFATFLGIVRTRTLEQGTSSKVWSRFSIHGRPYHYVCAHYILTLATQYNPS